MVTSTLRHRHLIGFCFFAKPNLWKSFSIFYPAYLDTQLTAWLGLWRTFKILFERSRANPFRLKQQISRLTLHPQRARRSWTCWASSQNLRRACEKSGKWRGLPKRKPLAFTRADGLRLTLAQS